MSGNSKERAGLSKELEELKVELGEDSLSELVVRDHTLISTWTGTDLVQIKAKEFKIENNELEANRLLYPDKDYKYPLNLIMNPGLLIIDFLFLQILSRRLNSRKMLLFIHWVKYSKAPIEQ